MLGLEPRNEMQLLRQEVADLRLRAGAYEAAKVSDSTVNWGFGGSGPTATNVQDAVMLRERSRDAWRNQPLMVRGMSLLVGRMLGESGMVPRFSSLQDDGLAAAARELWRDWSELCDHTGTLGLVGVQHQLLHAMYVDGGALCRMWFRPQGPGEIPLTLQPMETDYLSTWAIGQNIQGGIEIDGFGRVVAYHLLREHPGESWLMAGSMVADRIPAAEIAHLHLSVRPGQLYGVGAAHAALAPMRYLDDLGDADLVRMRAQATLAAIITGASAPQATSEIETPGGFGGLVRGSDNKTTQILEPGTFHYTDADSVTLTSPKSDANLPATVKQWHHLIAVAIGVQYHDLVGDLSAINYSSYRAGHITDRQETLIQRTAYVTPRLLTPMWRAWRVAAQARDSSMRRLPRRMEWAPPKWHSVDPYKDAQADAERIKAGLDSLSRAIEQTGADPNEVFASLAGDKQKLDSLGLTVSTILSMGNQ